MVDGRLTFTFFARSLAMAGAMASATSVTVFPEIENARIRLFLMYAFFEVRSITMTVTLPWRSVRIGAVMGYPAS